MIRITILSPALRAINFTDKRDHSARVMHEQIGWAHTVDSENRAGPFPEKFGFILPRGILTPYAEGDYTLHPSAFYVRDNKLLFNDNRLTPVKPKGEPSKTNAA